MRLNKRIELDEQNIIVREMTLGQVRQLIIDIMEEFQTNLDKNPNFQTFLTQEFDWIGQKMVPFISSENTRTKIGEPLNFNNLTASEIKTIWTDFCKLNPFFLPIEKLASPLTTAVLEILPKHLKQLTQTQSSL